MLPKQKRHRSVWVGASRTFDILALNLPGLGLRGGITAKIRSAYEILGF